MNTLKQSFRKAGLLYQLLKRSDQLCIYGVGGHYTDDILHYEVMKIRIRNNEYGHRESIPGNEEFGLSTPDRHYQTLAKAEEYFNLWEAKIAITGKEKPQSDTSPSLL